MSDKKEKWYQNTVVQRWASLAVALVLLLFVVSTKSDSASALVQSFMPHSNIASRAVHSASIFASTEHSSLEASRPADIGPPKINLDMLAAGPVVAPGDARPNRSLLNDAMPLADHSSATGEFALLSGSAGSFGFDAPGCVSSCSQVIDYARGPGGASFGGAYGFGGAGGFFAYPVETANTAASTSSSTNSSSTTGGAGSDSGNGDAPVSTPEPSAVLMLALGLAGIALLGLRGKASISRNA